MKLRWTRLSDAAQPPAPAHPGDAGYDLRAAEPARIEPGERHRVASGVALEIPDGYAGLV
ncbi:MAG: dUTP diphosphatase, partial [Thermoleophilaceae bacterium]